MSFALVTDSACSLPYNVCNELGLTVLPLSYFVDDVEHPGFFKDKPLNLKAFYEAMRNGASVRTSLPTPSETRATLMSLLQAGKDILYVGFSCALSGTYDSVHTICESLKEDFPQRRIACVETVAASFGEGLLVKHAAGLKKRGATMDEVIAWIEAHRMKTAHWITVDDLRYVLGGGRLGAGAAKAASLLNLKPILRIGEEGGVEVAGKARGRKKSLKAMVEKLKETYEPGITHEVVIAHADCEDEALQVKELIERGVTGSVECDVQYLDPVIGAHGGPGSMAIFFFGNGRK